MTSPRAAQIYTAPYHVLQQESGGEVLSCRPLLGKRAPILRAYLAQSFLLFLPPFSQTLFLPAQSSRVQTKATCESSCTCSTVTPESDHGRIQKLISEGANRNIFPFYTRISSHPGPRSQESALAQHKRLLNEQHLPYLLHAVRCACVVWKLG